MMLPTDMALKDDASFLVWAKKYADNEDLFMRDFGRVWTKLTELGCDGLQNTAVSSTL